MMIISLSYSREIETFRIFLIDLLKFTDNEKDDGIYIEETFFFEFIYRSIHDQRTKINLNIFSPSFLLYHPTFHRQSYPRQKTIGLDYSFENEYR